MRWIIFSYLASPETKLGAINYLIWLDQVNGLLLGTSMIIRAVLNLTPFPLTDIFGSAFCEWIDFPGTFYIAGSAVWSTMTAIYRILFIKATDWIRRNNHEQNVLVLCLLTGFTLHLSMALWLTMFDPWSAFEKLCTHRSNEEIGILLEYQVSESNAHLL